MEIFVEKEGRLVPTRSDASATEMARELFLRLVAVEIPKTRVVCIDAVGYGCDAVAEYDMPENIPTLRVSLESSFGSGSYIRSALWLPISWNGELLGLGNGGYGGTLCDEYWRYVTDGFAVCETDMGTSRMVSGEDDRFSIETLKDYGWRSTHIMTVAAKLIVAELYGEAPRRSFFYGSSAGGLQAFSEAQRYPEDYDGITELARRYTEALR